MKAAVVQLNSGEDVDRNLSAAEAFGREAAAAGAALVVMPENALYMGAEEGRGSVAGRYALGETPAGPCGDRMAALSRETGAWVLWGGVPEAREEDARTFNTAALVDERGVVVARYRKIHLFDIDLPGGPVLTESRNTAPGDALVVADSPVGRLGLSVCYDVRFPELYRGLVDGARGRHGDDGPRSLGAAAAGEGDRVAVVRARGRAVGGAPGRAHHLGPRDDRRPVGRGAGRAGGGRGGRAGGDRPRAHGLGASIAAVAGAPAHRPRGLRDRRARSEG